MEWTDDSGAGNGTHESPDGTMTTGPHRRAPRVFDVETEHTLKNHIAIIVGYCELLLAETPADDPRHADLLEMHRAATAVLAMFPQEPDA